LKGKKNIEGIRNILIVVTFIITTTKTEKSALLVSLLIIVHIVLVLLLEANICLLYQVLFSFYDSFSQTSTV
jgi:hypothetical protein